MSAHPERPATWHVACDGGVVSVTGDMDISTEQGIRRALFKAWGRAGGRLILDLSGVTFIDVRGLHVLLSLGEMAEGQRGRLAFVSPPPGLIRMIDVLELSAFPPLYSSLSDARRAVTDGRR